jgi:hypothetical protein
MPQGCFHVVSAVYQCKLTIRIQTWSNHIGDVLDIYVFIVGMYYAHIYCWPILDMCIYGGNIFFPELLMYFWNIMYLCLI